jgi:energy-coupling factor transporter ATP-binding protein EcfA2
MDVGENEKVFKNYFGDWAYSKSDFLAILSRMGCLSPELKFSQLLDKGIVFEENGLYKINYDYFKAKKELEEREKKRIAIPKTLIPTNFTMPYIARKIGEKTDVEILKSAIENKFNILLVGETGTGKTHLVYHVAKLLGRKVVRVNLDKATTPEDLIGFWQPTANGNGNGKEFKWTDGVLIDAMKNGWIFMCDEINAAPPEVLFLLNSVLDNREITLKQHQGETIKAHENFIFIGTMNPGTYEGVQDLNKALKSRFQVVLFFDYDEDIEKKLGLGYLVDFAKKIRLSYRVGEISTPISTRDLIYYHNNRILFGEETAKEILLAKFDVSERKAVEEVFDLMVKNKNGGENK